MEILSAKWLSDELEMEDAKNYFMYDQYQIMNCQDHYSLDNKDHQLNYFQSFSPDQSYTNTPNFVPYKRDQQNTTTTESTNPIISAANKLVSSSSSSSTLISFHNSNSMPASNSEKLYGSDHLECLISSTTSKSNHELRFNVDEKYIMSTTTATSDQLYYGTQNGVPKYEQGVQRVDSMRNIRSPSLAREHVMAERKRREKLSQKFIALSAVVPGLNKLDKASVLGDAVNYVKHLQERVKKLEEEQAEKKANVDESVIFVKRYQICTDDEISSSDEDNSRNFSNQPLPEIEVRVSNKDVLIRIYCQNKQKGGRNLANLLTEIEKLHLTIVNTSVLPLGSSTIDITVVARTDVEFCMKMTDLKENLRQALLN